MKKMWNPWTRLAAAALLFFGVCGVTTAQSSQTGQSGQTQTQQPAQSQDKSKTPEAAPLTLDAAPPVSAEEDAAFKAFQAVPLSDQAKRIELGEGFIQKYPQSRYLPTIYGSLTIAYMQANQIQKMIDVGEKAVALTPNDVTTLAILSQTISRVTNSNTPNAAQQLTKAEDYSKRAIEIVPTLPKPPNLTDEAFAAAKNQALVAALKPSGTRHVTGGTTGMLPSCPVPVTVLASHRQGRVWDINVGDWRVASADRRDLSVLLCQMWGQAA